MQPWQGSVHLYDHLHASSLSFKNVYEVQYKKVRRCLKWRSSSESGAVQFFQFQNTMRLSKRLSFILAKTDTGRDLAMSGEGRKGGKVERWKGTTALDPSMICMCACPQTNLIWRVGICEKCLTIRCSLHWQKKGLALFLKRSMSKQSIKHDLAWPFFSDTWELITWLAPRAQTPSCEFAWASLRSWQSTETFSQLLKLGEEVMKTMAIVVFLPSVEHSLSPPLLQSDIVTPNPQCSFGSGYGPNCERWKNAWFWGKKSKTQMQQCYISLKPK